MKHEYLIDEEEKQNVLWDEYEAYVKDIEGRFAEVDQSTLKGGKTDERRTTDGQRKQSGDDGGDVA